jgi:hypothetical protein
MQIRSVRFHSLQLVCSILFLCVLCAWMPARAQTKPQEQNPVKPGTEYSGMYSFLSDGEFVQLTVEDEGHVIGFISRYVDSAIDDGFVEQFFESGQLDGNQLTFTTKTVQSIAFEFRGTIERGEGKTRNDEAYYLLKGTLVEKTTDEKTTDATKKTSSRSSEVVLKSFPRNLASPQTQNK